MKISNRKSKGSQFELSCRDSLAQKYPDVLLTKQEGFVKGYDIWIPSAKIVIECKKHKGFSWNELEKYFLKLEERFKANKDENDNGIYTPYLIFQGNHQPCLVMANEGFATIPTLLVKTFESWFGIPFLKHKGKKEIEGPLVNKMITLTPKEINEILSK